MDSFDVNEKCKRPITNLKEHFYQLHNLKMHKIRENYYTVMKQPHHGKSKAKKIKV